MPEFLTLCSPTQALQKILAALPGYTPDMEEIDSQRASGRITPVPILASETMPAFPRSTVDGYAVRAGDTYGASDSLPAYLSLVGEVPMGGVPNFKIGPGEAGLIHTGGMLPEGANAVVMIENTQITRPGELEITRAAASAENILGVGEDVGAGEVIIPAGRRLRPAEIGGLMAMGMVRVQVSRQPRIGILSSGDEVILPNLSPQPGQVRDINSYALSALVEQNGGLAKLYGIVPDRGEDLRARISTALQECDMVVITAGSSASARDMTAEVVNGIGSPGVLVHGVNVRPGKPTILAVCEGKPVIGLPGNPVSALVIAGLFVTPLVGYLQGLSPEPPRAGVRARLSVNLPSQAGREEWIPVKLVNSDEGVAAEPVFFKSNFIFNLVRADGLILIPADATGLSAGTRVEVQLL